MLLFQPDALWRWTHHADAREVPAVRGALAAAEPQLGAAGVRAARGAHHAHAVAAALCQLRGGAVVGTRHAPARPRARHARAHASGLTRAQVRVVRFEPGVLALPGPRVRVERGQLWHDGRAAECAAGPPGPRPCPTALRASRTPAPDTQEARAHGQGVRAPHA